MTRYALPLKIEYISNDLVLLSELLNFDHNKPLHVEMLRPVKYSRTEVESCASLKIPRVILSGDISSSGKDTGQEESEGVLRGGERPVFLGAMSSVQVKPAR